MYTYLERVLRKMGLITPSSMLGNPPLESADADAGTPKTDDLHAPKNKTHLSSCA